ncbi:NAD dependent epimerase/dehydratase family protein [Sarocladium implicatum]|nr:NAD dependent epimerase/dehydratase family protein [Sarocladium implicatum]
MPHTLVTGANSFVGAHVIKALIDAGHTVTGSVRRASSGDDVLAEHPEWQGKLDFVEIPDYATPGAWTAVFLDREFHYIVHVASPMVDDERNTDYDRDWLSPAVNGELSLLRSAHEFGKSLKHVAITGSINAVTMGDDLADRVLTNESWLSLTREDARAANHYFVSYCSSKKESELAVRKFVETEKPSFGVTVFLPPLIFGPPIQAIKKPLSKGINFSVDTLYDLWNGKNDNIPATMFPSWIDVRDLAEAHVKSFTAPAARNKRFLIGGLPLTYTAMARSIKCLAEKGKLPESVLEKLAKEGEADRNTVVPKIEAGEATKALNLTFRTMDEMVKDTVERILELQAREKQTV